MKRITWLFCWLALLAWSAAVRADEKSTGEIVGSVRSADGSPIPGATVVLSGAGMISRSTTQISNAAGPFRFLNLNPGDYVVEVTRDGFMKATAQVVVQVGRTTTTEITLPVAGAAEAITVQAEPGLVDKTSPQISTTYSAQTLREIPLGPNREWVELMDTTAAINDKGAYGTGNGLDPETIDDKFEKGSPSSSYHLNGVDVSNQHYGLTWVNPEYDTIQEVQVLGPGADAQYTSFTGAVINLVTKSGSNDYHGSLSAYYTDQALIGDNSAGIEDLKTGTIKYAFDGAATFGGPIVKEKLLFFLAVGYHPSSTSPPQSTVFDTSRQETYQARLDYLLNPSNQISGMYNRDPITEDNLGLQPGSGPEIGYHYDFRTDTWTASWQAVWSTQTFSELKYAGYSGFNFRKPNSPDAISVVDYGTGHKYNSAGGGREFKNRRNSGAATLTHYLDNFFSASHEIKAGVEYEDAYTEDYAYYSGNAAMYLLPLGGGQTYVGGFLYDGSRTRSTIRRAGAFVQDDFRFKKGTTVSLGLRYDKPKLIDAYTGNTLTDFGLWSPRIGLTQVLGSRGATVFHASWGRYYDKLLDYSISFVAGEGHNPGFYYNFITSDPVNPTDPNLYNELFQPQNYSSTYNSGRMPIDPNLKSSFADAFTASLEHQLGPQVAVAGRFIYKMDRDFFALVDRAPHTYAPLVYDPGMGLAPVTVYTRTDSLPNDYSVSNADAFFRKHTISTVELQGRPSNDFWFRTSVTWERNTGTIENDFSGIGGFSIGDVSDPNVNGPRSKGILTYDRTWQFKLLGTYYLPLSAYLTADFRWYSGRAWTPVVYGAYIPGFSNPNFFSNSNLLLEQRGNRRWENTTLLNLRLAKSFRLGSIGSAPGALELSVDAVNLLNDSSPVDLGTSINGTYFLAGGSNFGQAVKVVKPRQFRFGARFSF
jgi:outer membrane receptor protein involved in Fe transport